MQVRAVDPHSTATAIRQRERERTINFGPCQKQGQEFVVHWLHGITAFSRRIWYLLKFVMRSGFLMHGQEMMGNVENCGSLVGPCEGEHQ